MSNHQPESWMREIRTSSSEGGEAVTPSSLPLSVQSLALPGEPSRYVEVPMALAPFVTLFQILFLFIIPILQVDDLPKLNQHSSYYYG